MQFISTLFVAMFIFLSSFTYGQEAKTTRKNIFKYDLLSPIARGFNFQYERLISERASIGIGGLYSDKSSTFTNADYMSRIAITPEYRYYMGRPTAPNGIYLTCYLRYQHLNAYITDYFYDYLTNTSTTISYQKQLDTYGAGIGFGYQYTFRDRITFDTNFGPIWNSGDKRELVGSQLNSPNADLQPFVGYFVRATAAIGVMF